MSKMLGWASLACVLAGSIAFAQYAAAPTQYSLVNVNTDETLHIYRDGNRALVDLHVPKGPIHRTEIHLRTIVDIASKTELTWNLLDPSVPCNDPSTGDWGDPFGYWEQGVQEGSPKGPPKKIGHETVNGMATTVFETTAPEGSNKLWREDRYGLLVKEVMAPKGHAPIEVFQIKDFKVGRPPASVFAVPARCKWPQ